MEFIINLLELDLNKPSSYAKIFFFSLIASLVANAIGKIIG